MTSESISVIVRSILRLTGMFTLVVTCMGDEKPNLIWIMADDLGYGEVGCYGQQLIQTPSLDRMAAEGLRFTHFYAGATVCAPSRSVLMTGLHHGHTRVRGNAGQNNPRAQALLDEDLTIAEVLQSAGYRTALIGKWGLGDVGPASSGLPNRQGFHEFFGFLNQQHAHNHFPDFLWRNETQTALPNQVTRVGNNGAGYATEALLFADDLFADAALSFVAQQQQQPFFLYWSMVIPHANNERTRALENGAHVPDFGPYATTDWPEQDKGHAAMITRLDSYVGRLLNQLQQLGLDRRTIVVFTSDNGPHNESRHNLERFRPAGKFSGTKRSLKDGGIRVPMIVWGPGQVRAGAVSEHVGYFGDWFATACELAGTAVPPGLDSISFAAELKGQPQPARHEYLYWEFHERGFTQACLYEGRWKAIRSQQKDNKLQLFDTLNDPAEVTDVSADHPELVSQLSNWLETARSVNPDWPITSGDRN